MKRSIPDLSAPEWTAHLAGLLEQASAAVARLDARFSVSPVRSAWTERATWTGLADARRAQGVEIDQIDIFSLACGVPLPGRRRLAFPAEEQIALVDWQRALTKARGRQWREFGPVPTDLPDDWRGRPALLRALEMTACHARVDGSTTPWLNLPALLSSLSVTHAPLPCLVVSDKAVRLNPRDRHAIVPRFLKAITRAAAEGLERLEAIEADRLRAAGQVAASLRPGKLSALTALLQRRPLLSPIGAARTLGLSKSGAGRLLARAAEAGLIVEISGRAAWKLYLTPDLATAFGFKARPSGRPPLPSAPVPLAPFLERFDAEMAAMDTRLAALGIAADIDELD